MALQYSRMPQISLASFNVHSGVDVRGRSYDVLQACESLRADVLVLQESWRFDDEVDSIATRVADCLDYQVTEQTTAQGRMYAPREQLVPRRGARFGRIHGPLLFDGERARGARAAHEKRLYRQGTWGVAVLSRLPVTRTDILHLGKLPGDYARRAAIRCELHVDGQQLVVVGTHMSHLSQGSLFQYWRLRRMLRTNDVPSMLAGDMNLWGPPVSALLPGWRRAIRGRTWPADQPHSQLDHILVTPTVRVLQASVEPDLGSDHRPVRVVAAFD